LYLNCVLSFHSYGFVEYDTIDEAKKAFENPENIELNGRILYIDYSNSYEMGNENAGKCFKHSFKQDHIFCICILKYISFGFHVHF